MATREQLIEYFADHKYATGEKFARLINSMKVVQLPVVDPQALGTSLSFIDSISQDADGKITATKKTLDLANAHEINPFKGWWKTGDTLPTTGFDGAYLYFKDTTQNPAVTTIYRWNGTTYADTGTEVDESYVNTFGSGQALNDVKIKNENGEDITGPAGVLSAEAGMELKNEFRKKYIYANTPQSYEDDVAEFYFRVETDEQIVLKSYAGKLYAQTKSAGIIARNTNVSENNVCYPISIYQSNDANYPVGSIFGYVVFKNVEHFLANPSSSALNIINSSYCGILSNSPIIDSSVKFTAINERVDEAEQEINGLTFEVENINDSLDELYVRYTVEDFVQGYTATQTKQIGDVISKVSTSNPYTSDSAAGQLVISVKAGDEVQLRFRDVSNIYCRNWILTDSTYHILSWAEAGEGVSSRAYNYIDVPLVLTVESDGYLFVQITKANYQYNSVGLEIRTKDTLVELIDKRIEDFGINSNKIEVCVPDTIFAVVGDTMQLYYRSIFRCVDFSKYAVKVVCNIGAQYPRYYEVTPLAGNVGTHALSFTIKDNNNNTLGTKSVNLVVVPVGTNPASELNVLCLGASATSGGQWASEFKRRLVGTGGTPAGSGKTNIQFVGRKNVTYNGKQVNLEATGGYSFPSYTNTNTARYRFDVTAENEPTINVDDVYSNNGNNYIVKEINITAGEGGYFSCEGTGVPQSSGTLTKVSGTGSETITYSSTSFSGNPFVYNGEINMQQYADDYCNPQGAAHGRIDVIYTELFGNGTSVYTVDFTTRMSQMQTFINQVRSVFPNCKFCIGLFWNPDIRGGMGVNYGASGNLSDPYGIKYSNMNLCNALQKYITDNNLSDYVFILNWLNEFDEENDMQQTNKKVNPRSNVTEIFGVNGVHPSVVGYNQMADSAWRLFIAKFCQGS